MLAREGGPLSVRLQSHRRPGERLSQQRGGQEEADGQELVSRLN
jgi:hypothetical protein